MSFVDIFWLIKVQLKENQMLYQSFFSVVRKIKYNHKLVLVD